MQKLLISLLILFTACGIPRQSYTAIDSVYTQDSYKILKLESSPDATYTKSIIVLDAGVDKRVERLFNELALNKSDTNYRLIGIGHNKFRNALRKRDFIPGRGDSFFCPSAEYLGEASSFKLFLLEEVIPQYDSETNERVLVGHSFGGVFSIYTALNDSSSFNHIISISPSLWLNRRSFTSHYLNDKSMSFKTPVSIEYGGLEELNLVAGSIRDFGKHLREADQTLVSIRKWPGKTHISILKHISKMF